MQEILKIAKDTNKINENLYFKNLNFSAKLDPGESKSTLGGFKAEKFELSKESLNSPLGKINVAEETLNKPIPLKLFLNSQEAFISAIDNWSKVLGLMISKVPSDLQRAVLIDNLNDEHGNGYLTKSHINTFRMLLVSLDYTEKIQLYNRYLPSYRYIKKFNDDLTSSIDGIIKIDGINWIYNIAILGMIEYVYVDVSKYIHAYLRNFLPPDKINHYSTHEILDVHHYTSLFQLLEPYIKTNYNEIYFGIRRGFKLMDELYFSLNYFLTGVISKL